MLICGDAYCLYCWVERSFVTLMIGKENVADWVYAWKMLSIEWILGKCCQLSVCLENVVNWVHASSLIYAVWSVGSFSYVIFYHCTHYLLLKRQHSKSTCKLTNTPFAGDDGLSYPMMTPYLSQFRSLVSLPVKTVLHFLKVPAIYAWWAIL